MTMGGPGMSLFNELKRRNVLRVAIAYAVLAWVMAQVAELLLDAFGAPDWALRSLFALFLVGFPFVVFFAWAYELTPEGVKRERDVDREASITTHTGRRLDRAIVVLLVLALGAFAWDRFAPHRTEITDEVGAAGTEAADIRSGPSSGAPERSIAVLPFTNMSGDPDNEYFSDGISEEILNLLAKLPELHVTSRSSAFQFKGDDINIPTVARQLGVAHVLEGSVRKSGMRVRITAQLIDADADRHLWSDTWDRELDDIFAIQDEIAAAVVDALQQTLLGAVEAADLQESRRTNPKAYELYLRGRHLTWARERDALREAERLYEQALGIDPAYAPAYAGLALALVFQVRAGSVDQEVAFSRADDAIARALQLEPDNPDALGALGIMRDDQGQYAQGVAALEKAIAGNPSDARPYTWLANTIGGADPVRSLALARKGYEIDPLARIVVAGLAWRLAPMGRYEEAMEQTRTFHALFPESNWAARTAADIHANMGRVDLALKSLYLAYRTQPESGYGFLWVPWALTTLGEFDLAAAWIAELVPIMSSWAHLNFQRLDLSALTDDPGQTIALMEETAARNQDPLFDVALAWALAFGGDFESARRVMEQAYPALAMDPPRLHPELWVNTLDYAVFLQRTGDTPRADRYLQQIQDLLERQIEAGAVWSPRWALQQELAAVHALQDRPEPALAALRIAAQQGGMMCVFCFRLYPHWDGLRDQPEFVALLEEQTEKLADQRQRLADEGMLLTPAQVLALDDFDFDPLAESP